VTLVAATGALKLSWLLLVFPLFGAVVLAPRRAAAPTVGALLGVAMPVAASSTGVIAFFALLGTPTGSRTSICNSYIPVAAIQVDVSCYRPAADLFRAC